MRTDPDKVKAVAEWSGPENRKHLQYFLGFVNFYRAFIRNYSQTALPVPALTFTLRCFLWSPEVNAAF